jgi:8-amino-7-oxononanoate synthase
VVTESYFSMEGDSPDLVALAGLCRTYDAALVVDEAHALGVFGAEGRGLCAAVGVRPDVLVGTAGKALGLQGAFVAGSRRLRLWLWNRARSFVFSTGVSPAMAAAIAMQVERVRADDRGRARLHDRVRQLREGLSVLGADALPPGRGPVMPWIVGDADAAMALSRRLRAEGVLVQAIRPPTVPAGGSRLRITANAGMTEGDVERALAAFRVAVGR